MTWTALYQLRAPQQSVPNLRPSSGGTPVGRSLALQICHAEPGLLILGTDISLVGMLSHGRAAEFPSEERTIDA